MDNSKSSSDIVDSKIKTLEYLRSEERHEITHISNRMGWFLTTESFLISAAIMSQSDDYPNYYGFIATLVLATFGCYLAMRTKLAVDAAQTIIDSWLIYEKKLLEEEDIDDPNCPYYWLRLPRGLHSAKKKKNRKDRSQNQKIEDKDACNDEKTEDMLHVNAIKLHTQLPYGMMLVWIAIVLVSLANACYRDSSGDYSRIAIASLSVLSIVGCVLVIVWLTCQMRTEYRNSKCAARELRERIVGKLERKSKRE
jgi:hypothetical protein